MLDDDIAGWSSMLKGAEGGIYPPAPPPGAGEKGFQHLVESPHWKYSSSIHLVLWSYVDWIAVCRAAMSPTFMQMSHKYPVGCVALVVHAPSLQHANEVLPLRLKQKPSDDGIVINSTAIFGSQSTRGAARK